MSDAMSLQESNEPTNIRRYSIREIVTSAVDGPFGSHLKSEHYVDLPGVRVVRLQNVKSGYFDDSDRAYVSRRHAATLSRHEVIGGDLIVASLGDESYPIARSCIYPRDFDPGIVKADCFRLRLRPELAISEYIQYVLNHPQSREGLIGLAQGITRNRVNLTSLLKFEVELPSVDEQRRIAEILDLSRQRIGRTVFLLNKLSQIRVAVVDVMFAGLVADSILGGVLAEAPRNGMYKPVSEYGEDGISIVRIDSLQRGEIRSDKPLQRVRLSGAEQRFFAIRTGDILINRVNSIDYVGKSALVRSVPEPMVFESNIMRCRVRGGRAHPGYLALWLGTPMAMKHFRSSAKSAVAQASINQRDVWNCPLPLPDLTLQESMVKRLGEVDQQIAVLRAELGQLRLLAQGLMDDLLTRRVRVPVGGHVEQMAT